MVRTLGFHPKNVGSNPASLKQLLFDRSLKLKKKCDFKKICIDNKQPSVKNTLKFVSLFTPSTFKDVSLFFRSEANYSSLLLGKPSKRILVKQSYIFLIWVRYLASQAVDTSMKDEDSSERLKYPSFFVYPFRNYKTTITKAPMAHKTYSQEQFMIRFYKFSISYWTGGVCEVVDNVNKSVLLVHFLRRHKPYMSTNMLFLHRYTVIFLSRDTRHFKFKRRIW